MWLEFGIALNWNSGDWIGMNLNLIQWNVVSTVKAIDMGLFTCLFPFFQTKNSQCFIDSPLVQWDHEAVIDTKSGRVSNITGWSLPPWWPIWASMCALLLQRSVQNIHRIKMRRHDELSLPEDHSIWCLIIFCRPTFTWSAEPANRSQEQCSADPGPLLHPGLPGMLELQHIKHHWPHSVCNNQSGQLDHNDLWDSDYKIP